MTLRPYQKQAVLRGMRQNLLVAHGCGTGKTYVGIHLILAHPKPAIILCPASTVESVWATEIQKIAPSLRPAILWGIPPKKREALLAERHPCYITTYETAKQHYESIIKKGFHTIVVDESSKMKSYSTQTTAFLLSLAGVPVRGGKYKPTGAAIPHRYCLSGTPAPNDPIEYWPQIKFVSGLGRSFHDNFYRFRDAYFHGYNITPVVKKWTFRKSESERFNEELSRWMDVVRTEDVLEYLTSYDQIRTVILSAKERRAYKQMADDYVVGNLASKNALDLCSYLRQLSSGFLYEDDRTNEFGTSKFNALRELLDELGDGQAVLWYHFHHERDQLRTIPSARFVGESNERARNIEEHRAGKFRYLIASPAMLGHGVNLQHCRFAVYYSLSPSYEQYEQSRRRILRSGQTQRCGFYYLIAKGTFDERLLRILRRKENVADGTLNYLKGLR